jgi:hypothetical protein
MATSNPSANRRFVTGVDTGNASSVGAFRAQCSVAQSLRRTWPVIGPRGLIQGPPSEAGVNGHFAAG